MRPTRTGPNPVSTHQKTTTKTELDKQTNKHTSHPTNQQNIQYKQTKQPTKQQTKKHIQTKTLKHPHKEEPQQIMYF